MKISVAIKAGDPIEVRWPEGAPLPASGDNVVLHSREGVIEFVVDDRVFTIDDEASGSSILIRGHMQPAGMV